MANYVYTYSLRIMAIVGNMQYRLIILMNDVFALFLVPFISTVPWEWYHLSESEIVSAVKTLIYKMTLVPNVQASVVMNNLCIKRNLFVCLLNSSCFSQCQAAHPYPAWQYIAYIQQEFPLSGNAIKHDNCTKSFIIVCPFRVWRCIWM